MHMSDHDSKENPAMAQEREASMPEAALEELGVEAKADAAESEESRFRALLEAIVYVMEEPIPAAQIAQALSQPKDRVEQVLRDLVNESGEAHRGVSIREVAGGFKMSTKPEFHDELRAFVRKLKPPLKLSQAALETLAVIAYKQPITVPEILDIRGVQGAGVLKTLLERKLVTTAGRKQVVGRPVLYKTTKEFLVQFGLKDLNELPTLKEFEEWSRLAMEDGVAQTAAEPAAEPESTTAQPGDTTPGQTGADG
jgi:segregation and condensation protein B